VGGGIVSVEIEITVGDATEIDGAAALVIPSNKQLSLGWGSHVAEKVLNRAGREVEREALDGHPRGIEMGEALITSAGAMNNFTHLIHAAVLDKYDLNPLFLFRLKMRTSPECLAKALRSSLQVATLSGLTSLVLTPMGAGIGGMKDGLCASIMLRELVDYGKSSSCGVEKVIIACFEKSTARHFENVLTELKAPGP
jgi:O-acetyl-ADP-ribose deacetylase (regulator of RNase III)